MKSTHTKWTLAIAALILPLAASGQQAVASSSNVPEDEAMEEILAVGNKSLGELRRDVWRYEEDFYAKFNELNDDRDFAVRCFYETPTGSHIKNHVCRARFVSNAYSANASRKRSNARRDARQDDDSKFEEKKAQFEEKMATLVAADPELQAALMRYNTARARFMAKLNEE